MRISDWSSDVCSSDLAACAAPIRLNAVPEERTTDAGIPGIPGARFWVDNESEPFVREALQSFEKEKAYLAGTGHTGALPPVSFLAVSGGGDNRSEEHTSEPSH